MPVAETELAYRSPYELIVAVILSAQCTDKRVNIITQEFFKLLAQCLDLLFSYACFFINLLLSVCMLHTSSTYCGGFS